MKKVLITSAILILVPTLIFLPVYLYLYFTSVANAHDYMDDVRGQWSAIQYYHGKDRVACNDESYMNITFEDDRIAVDGTVLPEADTDCIWESGTTLSYEVNGEKFTYLISFDNNNNLKIIVDGTSYIILLRRSGG